MFPKNQDDKTREWNTTIQRYIALHKYIKEVGKISISQARSSGHVNADVQSKLADALRQTDTALNQLKVFFKPCLTIPDVTDLFPQEQPKVEELNQEISKLKHENEALRQESDGDAGLQIRNLKRELFLTQQEFDRKYESFLKQKHYLEEKVAELTEEIQSSRGKYQNISLLDANGSIKNGNLQKKQQELEETLKTQNDLIYNLKQQLFESEKDREIFKSLNRNLEMELHKKIEYPERYVAELQNGKDYIAEDYFKRSTLKIGDYNSQKQSWKHNESFGQYFQNGADKDYEAKFQSLQEIPVFYEQEKKYLKSKSYDYELDDDHFITKNDYNSQQNEEEKKMQDSVKQLEQKKSDDLQDLKITESHFNESN